jgi:phosphatidylglycerol:prolipoprotein diacylglycerol transferase
MFDLTPDPIAISIGPLALHWYGISYAVGLTAVYLLVTRLAARAGRNPAIVGNGMIVVAIAALVGGRAYHVIDQWQLYGDDLLRIVLPPYAGLGVYGGLATGTIAAFVYLRRRREPFWVWADIAAPGLFVMQAVGRWGNFFNQELYGPPTTLPWGIPIDCAHRVAEFACATFPETTRFHPLFLYESVSGLLGAIALVWLGLRFRDRLRPGDLLLVFFIWYAAVRFALETLRTGNWLFFGIPTAMLVSAAVITVAGAILVWRHRGGRGADAEPTTSGEPRPANTTGRRDRLADQPESSVVAEPSPTTDPGTG